MRDDTNRGAVEARAAGDETLGELGLPLEALVRRGAREILQRAIEAEVQVVLERFAEVGLIDGRRAVVRNGYLPTREILTTVGPVEVRVPKVGDRTRLGIKFNVTGNRAACFRPAAQRGQWGAPCSDATGANHGRGLFQ